MGKTKTARFTAVVQKAGRPQTFVLWQDPKKDPGFQSALQQERVMTVFREAKGKDYGVAGFKRGKAATYPIPRRNWKRSRASASWASNMRNWRQLAPLVNR